MTEELEPRPGSVLVVIDDEELLLVAVGPLRAAGYEVSTVANGAQALTRLALAAPDVVVADADLPDITPFELVAVIRRNPALEHVPLIFLTAAATAGDLALGLGLGAEHYLVSPPDPSVLVSRVAAVLVRSRARKKFAPARPVVPASRRAFDRACARAFVRSAGAGPGAALALLTLYELDVIRRRLGPRADRELGRELGHHRSPRPPGPGRAAARRDLRRAARRFRCRRGAHR